MQVLMTIIYKYSVTFQDSPGFTENILGSGSPAYPANPVYCSPTKDKERGIPLDSEGLGGSTGPPALSIPEPGRQRELILCPLTGSQWDGGKRD